MDAFCPSQGERPQELPKLNQVIQIDEGKIQEHLGEVVRSTVEETLNAMLDAEADRLCRAERYERTEARKDTRAGSYQRHLQTKAGEVTLKVPKLHNLPFETAIIERYRRRGEIGERNQHQEKPNSGNATATYRELPIPENQVFGNGVSFAEPRPNTDPSTRV